MVLDRRIALGAVALLLIVAAVATAEPLVMVVNKSDDNLQLFNAKTLAPITTISTGKGPHEVITSPDGRYAYVGDYHGTDNTVSIIDLAKRKRVDAIKIDPYSVPHGLSVTKDGKKLYVTAEQRRCVVEVDLPARKVTRAFRTDLHITHMCAVTPDGSLLVASNSRAGNISIFDVGTGELDRHLLTGGGVEGLDITADGKYLWTANAHANSISVIDLEQKRLIATVPRPGYPLRVKVTPDGKEVWVTCSTFGKVAVFDTKTRQQVAEVRVGAVPIGLAIDADGKYVYVTNQDDATLSMIDRAKREVVRSQDTGKRPEGVACTP